MQTEMSQRYRKFKRRWGVYHVFDTTTGLSKSLDTRSKQDAERLVHAMNEAVRQPMINRQMARAYLMASDPQAMTRTWQFVMDEKIKTVTGGTRERWLTAIRDRAFNLIRKSTLVETRPEDFKAVLEAGRVATNVFLRKLHNFALDMNWLLGPVLPKAQWPKVKYPPKRAITEDEHRRICEREQNPERRAFFQVLWHTGASQTDAAFMEASNVDLGDRLLTYRRKKTSEPAQIEIGPELEAILRTLPASGPLFP